MRRPGLQSPAAVVEIPSAMVQYSSLQLEG